MLRFVADYRSQRVVDGRVRVFNTETVCFTSKYSICVNFRSIKCKFSLKSVNFRSIKCTFPLNKV